MSKDRITDYSATAADNTEIGGVGITGNNNPSNLDDAIREVMSHLAETNAGTYPVADTWTFADPADATKAVRLDAGGVTAGQTRVLASPDRNGTLMTGPASTTDNTLPRFDSTAGNIQTSGVTVDDSNNITTPASVYAGVGVGTNGQQTTNGAASNSSGQVGVFMSGTGASVFARETSDVIIVNKIGADGVLLSLRGQGNEEGAITVSGSTVAYGTFTGFHWSQLEDGSSPEILKGTLVETVDQLCQWRMARYTNEYGGELKRAVSRDTALGRAVISVVGDDGETREYEAVVELELNEHLPCFKVSDTPGGSRPYGVFMGWDDDGDAQIASLGVFLIRIAAGVAVQGGDLIESNGDGCGRVMADDLSAVQVRKRHVATITSAQPVETYPDGSKLYPATVHCG